MRRNLSLMISIMVLVTGFMGIIPMVPFDQPNDVMGIETILPEPVVAADPISASGTIISDPNGPKIDLSSPKNPLNDSYIRDTSASINVSVNGTGGLTSSVMDIDGSLVAWWSMEDYNNTNTSRITVKDIVGNIDGVISGDGSIVSNSIFDKGLEFDGNNDTFTIPHQSSLSINDEMTIEAWVNTTSEGVVLQKGSAVTAGYFDNFENGFTNWTNVYGDDFDWYLDRGGTPSSSTGPYYDHTTGTTSGYYLYTEASSYSYDQAFLESPVLTLTGESSSSVEFWYHMYGSSMGTLSLQISAYPYSSWSTLWSRSGQQHYSSTSPYSKAQVSLSAYSGTYKLRIRGYVLGSYRSDMAIDDIRIYNSGGTPFLLSTKDGGEFMIGSEFNNISAGGNITDGKWHHLAGTFDGTNIKLYVDGLEAGSRVSTTPTIPVNSKPLILGQHYNSSNGTNYFDGLMDNIRIHKRSLSASEIKALCSGETQSTFQVDLTSLSQSKHSVDIFSQNENGNISSRSLEFTVDYTSPNWGVGTGMESSGSTKGTPDFTVNFTKSDLSPVSTLVNLDNSIFGWWTFQNPSSSTYYNDLVYGRSMLIRGGINQTRSTIVGNGLRLDGFDDCLEGPQQYFMNTEEEYTVGMWFSAEDDGILISEGNGANGWKLSLENGGKPTLVFKSQGTTPFKAYADLSLDDGSVHHLTVVMNGDRSSSGGHEVRMIIDGVERTVLKGGDSVYTNPTSYILVGSNVSSSSPFFKGMIDELVLIKRGLTDVEIDHLVPKWSNRSLHQIYDDLRDGDHTVRPYFQDRAGNTISGATWNFRTEFYTTEVTIPRELWISGVTYTLKVNLNLYSNHKFSITGNDLIFDLQSNTIDGNGMDHGITIVEKDNCFIRNGNIREFQTNILFKDCVGGGIQNIYFSYSYHTSIKIETCKDILVDGNTFYGGSYGVDVIQSENITVKSTTVSWSPSYVVRFDNVVRGSISNINNQNIVVGIEIKDSCNIDLSGITASNCNYAIRMDGSNSNVLDQINSGNSNEKGIELVGSSNNKLSNITSNGDVTGLILETGSNNNIVKNSDFSGDSTAIMLDRSEMNDFSDISMTGGSYGLHSISSDHNSFCDIRSTQVPEAIVLESSFWNEMMDIDITASSQCGIRLDSSDQNILGFSEIGQSDRSVILEHSNDNSIFSNDINNNEIGILIRRNSDGNSVIDNIIRDSGEMAIRIDDPTSWGLSSENMIFNNTISNNNQGGIQCFDNGMGNSWNGESRGNFWSDHYTQDLEPDGIVDIPYEIPSIVYLPMDRYPLANPADRTRLYIPRNNIAFEDDLYLEKVYFMALSPAPVLELDSEAQWLTVSNDGTITGTPTQEEIGTYHVYITLTDGSTVLQDELVVTVMNSNDPPSLPHIDNLEVKEDEILSFFLDGVDPDPMDSDLSYTLEDAPDFIHIDNEADRLIAEPGNGDVGEHNFIIHVLDQDSLSSFQIVTLVVVNVNDDPIILPCGPFVIKEDIPFNFKMDAIDIDPTEDEMTWSIGPNSGFLTVDPITGTISGTPENDHVGLSTITIDVEDGKGGSGSVELTFHVLNINDPPVANLSQIEVEIIEDSEKVVDLKDLFFDPDGDPVNFFYPRCSDLEMEIRDDSLLFLDPAEDFSGEMKFTIHGSDGVSRTPVIVVLSVKPTNDPPEIREMIQMDSYPVEGRNLDLKVDAFDLDGDQLTCIWFSNRSGEIGRGLEIEVSLPAGPHLLRVMIQDGNNGQMEDSMLIMVHKEMVGAQYSDNNETAVPAESPDPYDFINSEGSRNDLVPVLMISFLCMVLIAISISVAVVMKRKERMRNDQ